MPTIHELIEATPAPTRGVPAGFVHGAGVWRHVLELADPGVGAAVVWHDLTTVDGLFTGYEYNRGSDGYQGRYRASIVDLDLYASSDMLAPWNPDNSGVFGTHVDLGPGLLIRSGFIRVVGGVVDSWNPRFTLKVESWGDASYSRGRVRRHRVTARDTLSSLVGVPLPARTAENWFERLVWIISGSGWPYGWFAYGARHEADDTTPILLLPDRPASSSALNELDATLDPVGLQWYTDRQGRLIVRPRVNDTFHAAAFAAGATGDPWPDSAPVEFAWWACMGDPPASGHAAYAVDTPGVDPFGFDETDRWVINHVKVTDPTGPGFDDDNPVSIQRYDRKTQQMQWQAPNDTVAADLLAMRANATVEARPLHTNLALANFHPGPANAEFLDYVTILHRNTDDGFEAFGNGWLRGYTEQVRPLGCDTDWSLALTVDIYNISAAPTSLLPVEDLTLVDVTDTQAEFSWTNPAQTVEPTHTQIRLINPASLWATVEYPLTGLTWSGLIPETGYEFQIRLIRKVDGITTHYSPIRALNFATLEATVPVVDDGDVILPPPDDGCEVFWELVSSPDGTDPWTVEDSGTITEPPYELADYDMSLLDPLLWYRFQTREICDGLPGPLQPGDPFVVDCIGADRLEVPPYDDANLVAYWPEFCPNGSIVEAVTHQAMIKGHALTRVEAVDDVAALWSGGGGLVGYQIITSPAGSHDLSIGCRVMIGTQPFGEVVLFEYGGLLISIVPALVSGFTVNGTANRGAVVNTIEGATIYPLDTVVDLLLTHDPGTGQLILYVDSVEEVAATLPFGDRASFGQMAMSLPTASWITDAAAWDRILVPTPPFVPIEFVGAFGGFDYSNQLPATIGILPGDYALVLVTNLAGGTVTLPAWLDRLDGGTTAVPCLAGGFFETGLEWDGISAALSNFALGLTIPTSGAATHVVMACGIYRNVNPVAVDDWLTETLATPGNLTLGPVNVPTDGVGVALIAANVNNATAFVMNAPANDRYSIETAATIARLLRVADVAGANPALNFTTSTYAGTINHSYAASLAPGPPTYAPTNTISMVGVGATVGTLSGTTVTVPLPAGIVDGDLMLCVLHLDSNQNAPFSPLAGWTQYTCPNGPRTLTVFAKRAVGGFVDPTFTAVNSGTRKQGISIVYRNVGGLVHLQGAAGGTLTPDAATWTPNTVAVACCISDFYQPITLATANGYTMRTVRSDASDGGVSLSDKTIAAPGAPSFPVHTAPTGPSLLSGLIYLVPD